MRRVIVETPYAGDIETNLHYLRACMRDCLLRGESQLVKYVEDLAMGEWSAGWADRMFQDTMRPTKKRHQSKRRRRVKDSTRERIERIVVRPDPDSPDVIAGYVEQLQSGRAWEPGSALRPLTKDERTQVYVIIAAIASREVDLASAESGEASKRKGDEG